MEGSSTLEKEGRTSRLLVLGDDGRDTIDRGRETRCRLVCYLATTADAMPRGKMGRWWLTRAVSCGWDGGRHAERGWRRPMSKAGIPPMRRSP